jgi:hypothetical protein
MENSIGCSGWFSSGWKGFHLVPWFTFPKMAKLIIILTVKLHQDALMP